MASSTKEEQIFIKHVMITHFVRILTCTEPLPLAALSFIYSSPFLNSYHGCRIGWWCSSFCFPSGCICQAGFSSSSGLLSVQESSIDMKVLTEKNVNFAEVVGEVKEAEELL